MSKPNAERALPHGDRDNAPELSFEASESIAPQSPRGKPDPLDGMEHMVGPIGRALRDALMAYVELSNARKGGNKLDCNVAANKIAVRLKDAHKAAFTLSRAIVIGRS